MTSRVFFHHAFGINACYLILLGLDTNTAWIFALGCVSLVLELITAPTKKG